MGRRATERSGRNHQSSRVPLWRPELSVAAARRQSIDKPVMRETTGYRFYLISAIKFRN
jgi:hypothetical protein